MLYVGYTVYLLSVLPVQNLRFLDWRVHFGAAKLSMFGTPKGWGLGSPLAAASSSRRCTASGWGSPIGLALVPRSSSGRRGPPPMVWWSVHVCTTQRKCKASHVRTSSACSLARHLPCPPMSWAVCVVQCPSRTSRSVTTFSSTSVSLPEVTS